MRATVFFQHQEAQNTNGGTATAGSWEDRKITNITSDLNSIVSLDALTGIMTVQPGNYIFDCETPFRKTDRSQSRLVDVDSGAILVTGDSVFGLNASGVFAKCRLYGVLSFSTSKRIKVQSRVDTTVAGDGYGLAANFTTEVYTKGSLSVLG